MSQQQQGMSQQQQGMSQQQQGMSQQQQGQQPNRYWRNSMGFSLPPGADLRSLGRTGNERCRRRSPGMNTRWLPSFPFD
jgi:hypothetical protein